MRMLLLAAVAWSLTSCESASVRADPSQLVHYVNDINSNLAHFDRKTVSVRGYVRYGFDGWDIVCEVATARARESVVDVIWLEDARCYEAARRHEYKEGMAVVLGEVHAYDEETYVQGAIYTTEMVVSRIQWSDESHLQID